MQTAKSRVSSRRHPLDDGPKVVVQDHNVSCLLGHLRACSHTYDP